MSYEFAKLQSMLLILLLGMSGMACSVSDFAGRNDGPPGKAKDDGERPHEEGEGVPGYLTDPALIKAVEEGEMISITGAKGAVGPDDSEHHVCAHDIASLKPDSLKAAKLLGETDTVGGGFSLLVESGRNLLVIRIADDCDTPLKAIKDNAAVGSAGGDGFKDLSKTLSSKEEGLSQGTEQSVESDGSDGGDDDAEDGGDDTNEPEPKTCGADGRMVGDTCVYLAAEGQNCIDACAGRGGCDGTAINTVVGTASTAAQCQEAFLSLGIGEGQIEVILCAQYPGLGCYLNDDNERVYCSQGPANCERGVKDTRRLCTCNE